MDVAQLSARLESLLHDVRELPVEPAPRVASLGSPIGTRNELRSRLLALRRAATSTLSALYPAGQGAHTIWGSLPQLRPNAATPHRGGGADRQAGHQVRHRTVFAPPGRPRDCADDAVRVSELVTSGLFIRDGAEAILVAHEDEGAPAAALHTTHPSFVHYLTAVFESVWEHATPAPAAQQANGGETFGPEERELLVLLRRGLTDASIARELGVSVRTVQRRASSLQQRLGVSGRFQLGLRVGIGANSQSMRGSTSGRNTRDTSDDDSSTAIATAAALSTMTPSHPS